jgi:predicted regulator of Ras-like GTPase activity (Roadblock/LC7/MglB family)
VSANASKGRRDVRALVRTLAEAQGVTGALLVAPDGLVIASHLPEHVGVEVLSALAATLGRELELRAALPGHGPFVTARFAGEAGTLIVGASPIGFVVVLAQAGVDVTSEVRAAATAIEEAWPLPALA